MTLWSITISISILQKSEDIEKVSNFPKVTQLVNGRTGIWIQAVGHWKTFS